MLYSQDLNKEKFPYCVTFPSGNMVEVKSSRYPFPNSTSLRKHKHFKGAMDGEEPDTKIRRINESKMVSGLSNFHITPTTQQRIQADTAFWMQKPEVSFKQLEERMSDDELDEESASMPCDGVIKLDPTVRDMFKLGTNTFGPWIRQPKEELAVVLWKPPEDFVKSVAHNSFEECHSVTPDRQLLYEDCMNQDGDSPFVTFPSPNERPTLRARRRSPSPSSPSIHEIDDCEMEQL